ncbi:MAG: hypothetical protein JWN32_1107 [Solirubrobacterales bacterium]|jgi:hypothetical protein|nr:hypothetical protein [Solirubrobacterales bacterium]
MSGDTKTLIETAAKRFVAEVPALEPLKLVVGLELRGRGDVQLYRVEMPGPKVTKDIAADSRVQLFMPRAIFNELAEKGHIAEWRDAFENGHAKASGQEAILKLIVNVVERQEERARTRKARR